MKPKLAVLVTHPIQHFAPVYRAIAEQGRIDLSVIFLTDTGAHEYFDRDFGKKLAWDVDLLSGYHHRILRPGLDRVPKGFRNTYFPGLTRVLKEENPSAVMIYGYTRGMNWTAWRWARRNKGRILYCSDSVLLRPRSGWRLRLKAAVLPWFFRGVDVFLAAGDRNEDYFAHYGVPRSRMLRCPLPVDVTRLRSGHGRDLAEVRAECRQSLSIDEQTFVVLQCGKLSTIKRPLDLAKAIASLRQRGENVAAIFVGTGILMDELKALANASSHSKAIMCPGFVNQSALFRFYAAADVLAIPSEEDAHPLVAAEAAVYGLPIIASDQVGCVGPTDAAQPGQNALVFPCGDTEALAARIENLIRNPELRHRMSQASSRIADTQDISVAARAIEEGVMRG
jgi:glycosyltransferase involved in cell wall biosynthesis